METKARLKDIMNIALIKPRLDFMLLEMVPRDTNIVMINNQPESTDVFVVRDIGPGHYQEGVFIKPDIKVGDKVIIVGNLFNVKYKGISYTLARCREVIAVAA